jgi:hypothetical protein
VRLRSKKDDAAPSGSGYATLLTFQIKKKKVNKRYKIYSVQVLSVKTQDVVPENITHERSLPRSQLHQLDRFGLTHLHPFGEEPDGQALTEHLTAPDSLAVAAIQGGNGKNRSVKPFSFLFRLLAGS